MDAPELFFMPSTELRKKAEEHLQTRAKKRIFPTPSLQDTSSAIHELGVHQIELELQNEELRRTQLLLETSRARYQTLYDHAPVGYLTLDGNGVIGETNLAATNLLGSGSVRLRGVLLSDFIAPDDQDTFYHYRRLLFQLLSPGTIELRVTAANQGVRWLRLEGVVEQNTEGNFEGRLVLSDQTTRKLAEDQTRRALADLEAAYRVQEKHLAALTSKSEELDKERHRGIQSVQRSNRATETRDLLLFGGTFAQRSQVGDQSVEDSIHKRACVKRPPHKGVLSLGARQFAPVGCRRTDRSCNAVLYAARGKNRGEDDHQQVAYRCFLLHNVQDESCRFSGIGSGPWLGFSFSGSSDTSFRCNN